ncbi:LOW QUALITY PROTEIN: hypothetical protein ACHAWX_001092 [Stephanocyclus meneghinianus]
MVEEQTVVIPAVYITMEEADILLDAMRGAFDRGDPLTLSVFQRYVPKYNFSAVLIWAFGSSGEYRRVGKGVESQMSWNGASVDSIVKNDAHSAVSTEERGVYRAPSEQEQTTPIDSRTTNNVSENPDSLKLTASRALGFIVVASTSLLVLFFFKIFNVVKIIYAFGCSGACNLVVHPGFTVLDGRCQSHVRIWLLGGSYADCRSSGIYCVVCQNEVGKAAAAFRVVDRGESIQGGGKGWMEGTVAHVPVGVFRTNRSRGHSLSDSIFWHGSDLALGGIHCAPSLHPCFLLGDIFGTCMCILFLTTIKPNSIRVAAVLLTVAFFYDIFIVYVTLLLTKHGESITVNVAMTGGPPKVDPSWCENYPFDADCKGGDPLSMLFAIPRIGCYQGGFSLLGLVNIVLPGLLLSFAPRYDEAKRLMGVIGGSSGRMRSNACPDVPDHKSSIPLCFICCCCRHGYFGPVMVAYAIGLVCSSICFIT